MKSPFILVLLWVILMACSENERNETYIDNLDQNQREIFSGEILTALSQQVLTYIADTNFDKLSEIVHPVEGLTISPYGFIDTNSVLIFSKKQVKELWSHNRYYIWGIQDGSGEVLKMTFPEYYERYIYDFPFLKSPVFTKNQVAKEENSLANTKDVFPEAQFFDFHFPGSDHYEGMDWKTLRLVFQQYNSQWYLIAIVHEQWII